MVRQARQLPNLNSVILIPSKIEFYGYEIIFQGFPIFSYMTSPSFRLYVVMRFEVWRIKNLIEAEISVCWLNWIWTSRPLPKGAFTNYVYMICLFLTTYPPSVYIFYGIKVYKKSIFLTTYPPSSCKRSLWTTPKLRFPCMYN